MHATSTTTVSASTAHVWGVLSDHEGMAHWAPGLSVRLRSEGTTERNGLGAVREIAAPGPAPAIVEEIVSFEAGRHLGYKALSGVPLRNYRGDVVLREVSPGRTEITYTITADRRIPLVEHAALKAISWTLLTALARRVAATA